MSELITWIAVDWGTTHLRAYAMNDNDQVINEDTSNKGMGVLASDQFEPALLELIRTWLPKAGSIPVVACGMVGARQGWVEAPYKETPCRPYSTGRVINVETLDSRIQMHILPGISQLNHPDVMRGEETQIAGLLVHNSSENITVCLPGTHTKWVSLRKEKILHFSTFMTGEMFSMLTSNSILKHSTSKEGWDESSFLDGVQRSAEDPEKLLSYCFGIRANHLLNDFSPVSARSYLSGLLIGAEITGAKEYTSARPIVIIGETVLTSLYVNALTLFDVEVETYDPIAMTLAGLIKSYKSLFESQGD